MSEHKKYLVMRKSHQKRFSIYPESHYWTNDLSSITNERLVDGSTAIYEIAKKINISLERIITEEDL